MCQQRQSNIVSQEENDSSLETKLEVTEDCDLTDREFKTVLRKKLNKLWENSEK